MKRNFQYIAKKSNLFASLIALILVLSLTCPLNAQNIGNWTLNNTLAGTGTAFNTVGNISLGSGITSGAFNGGTEYYGQNGWPAGGLNTTAYFQFSLSPISGYMLNISTLTLRMRRSSTGSPAGSGPTSWAVRSSVDGFTSNLATGTMTHNYANYIVTLTAFTYLTSTVTFRVYGYTSTVSSGGSNRLVFDNISVQGATGTLPVHFALFNACKIGTGVEIKWTASSITSGTIFGIERSSNGIDFSVIKELEETTDRASGQYAFTDHSIPSGKSFYRVLALEPSGLVYRTAIAVIENKGSFTLAIEKITIQGSAINTSLQVPERGTYTIAMISINGEVLLKKQVNLEVGLNSISVMAPSRKYGHGPVVMSLYGRSEVISRQFIY